MNHKLPVIEIYDTTLRDGAQAEDVSFSVEDKVRIAVKLDELGVHFIEGGWPGANPKDIEFFRFIKSTPLQHAKIVAFGSTRKAKNTAKTDPTLKALLSAETEIVTIFGKSWTLHVTEALETTLAINLELIADSIEFLRSRGRQVFYDAEHFFDGYKTDPDYAMKTIQTAAEAGAARIILCDTNGGTMPWDIGEIFATVRKSCEVPLGIHAHNDAEMARRQFVGGRESRSRPGPGNHQWHWRTMWQCQSIFHHGQFRIKNGRTALGDGRLAHLRTISHFVAEMANLTPNKRQPYVGDTAFAHKGGVHIHAVQKNPLTYEHVVPDVVGNHRRVLISDNSGRSAVFGKMEISVLIFRKIIPRCRNYWILLKRWNMKATNLRGRKGHLNYWFGRRWGPIVHPLNFWGAASLWRNGKRMRNLFPKPPSWSKSERSSNILRLSGMGR